MMTLKHGNIRAKASLILPSDVRLLDREVSSRWMNLPRIGEMFGAQKVIEVFSVVTGYQLS